MKTSKIVASFLLLWIAGSALGYEHVRENYLAIYMDGSKVGHATERRTETPEEIRTAVTTALSLSRGGFTLDVTTEEVFIEDTKGNPLGFEFDHDMGLMTMKGAGTVEDGKMTYTVDRAGHITTETVDWPAGALMSEGATRLSRSYGLEPGTTYTLKLFTPSSLTAMDATVTIGEREQVDLLGRITELVRVETALATPSGSLTQVTYIDDDHEVKKMVTEMMGMTLEMIEAPKEFAMSESDTAEFFMRTLVESPEPLADLDKIRSIEYRLKSTAAEPPKIPSTDSQEVEVLDDGAISVTVTVHAPPENAFFPYGGGDEELRRATHRSLYITSDDPKVIAAAVAAVGREGDAWKAAKAIEKYVSSHIDEKNLDVGYASASEVIQSRTGDCTEHAVLVAAMCRAVGIPARIAVGVVYADAFAGARNVFGPHAWTEVNIDGKWYGLDATGAPRGFSAGHITFATGDGMPQDFIGLANILGQFSIESMKIERMDDDK